MSPKAIVCQQCYWKITNFAARRNSGDFVAYFRQGTDSDLDTQPMTEPGKGTLFRSYTIFYILSKL